MGKNAKLKGLAVGSDRGMVKLSGRTEMLTNLGHTPVTVTFISIDHQSCITNF